MREKIQTSEPNQPNWQKPRIEVTPLPATETGGMAIVESDNGTLS